MKGQPGRISTFGNSLIIRWRTSGPPVPWSRHVCVFVKWVQRHVLIFLQNSTKFKTVFFWKIFLCFFALTVRVLPFAVLYRKFYNKFCEQLQGNQENLLTYLILYLLESVASKIVYNLSARKHVSDALYPAFPKVADW